MVTGEPAPPGAARCSRWGAVEPRAPDIALRLPRWRRRRHDRPPAAFSSRGCKEVQVCGHHRAAPGTDPGPRESRTRLRPSRTRWITSCKRSVLLGRRRCG